nr:tight adherence pilus pseudopilin TadF [Vibrio eleionomae]
MTILSTPKLCFPEKPLLYRNISVINSPSIKHKGSFTVEFAIVGVFFALLLVFSGDLVIKLSMKGKLERLSYSMVSVLKERTQLFDEDTFDITNTQATDIYNVAANSMQRTMGKFEAEKFGVDLKVRQRSNYGLGNSTIAVTDWNSADALGIGISCNGHEPDRELIFQTSWGRSATLYEVTLCYSTPNWFGQLVDEQYLSVSANAITLGR